MFTNPQDSARGKLLESGLTGDWPFRSSGSLLATNLPLFSRLVQLLIPLGMDLLLTPGNHVLGSDVANGAIQADVVVMLDVALHKTPRIVQRQSRSGPNALSFERFVPTLDFPFDWG